MPRKWLSVLSPRWAATILFLALATPSATAEAFRAPLPFTDVAAADHMSVLSGSLDVRAPARGAPALMHNVSGFQIDGLDVVCWEYPCHESPGALVVRVAAGSTVALRFPTTGSLHLRAAHAVASPVALDAARSGFSGLAATLRLAPSLAAVVQDGELSVGPETLPAAPDGAVPVQPPPGLPRGVAAFFQGPDPDDGSGAVLATLTPWSRIEVIDGGRLVHAQDGYGGLLLQGTIVVQPVRAEAFLVPCIGRCDVEVTDQGRTADVAAATSFLLGVVALAQGSTVPPVSFGPWGALLDPMATGAFVDFPLVASPADFRIANLTVVRFDRFQASLYPGAPENPGDGPLVIQSGSVQGAPEFVGGPYFGMPLWSYVLWIAALVAFVVRVATRAPKEHDRWDRWRWVGRVLGLLGWLGLAVLWHVNFDRVLGVSATSGGLDTGSRWLVGAVEAATLLAMALVVVLPARILIANVLRTARQGRFMGLSGPLASGVGILFGAPLLLGFVDLVLQLFQ